MDMKPRAGFSVVVVLGLIILIGVLVGLLLPAHRAARESGRPGLAEAPASTASHPSDDSRQLLGRAAEASGINDAYMTAFQVDGQADESADHDRRIIYEAQIAIVVDNLAEVESSILRLLTEADGYVAESNVTGRQGDQLSGTWRVRVPIAEFEQFLGAVAKLGVTEHRQQTAQDVSEEFVDVEARLATQKELERRIVALLDSASDEIKDILEVERELARVRGEIERMEGRLRYLTNRVDLTTVSITVREERDYVPAEAPTFTTQVRQAWNGSLEAMRQAGEQLSIAFVSAAPWIIVVSVVLSPLGWYLGRRQRAVKRGRASQPPGD